MRRCAYRPSRINSAAAARTASGSLDAQAQIAHFFHQSLNGRQLLHHGGGIDALIELQRTAQIEPLDDLPDVGALEILVVDLAHRNADQLAGHGVAAFQLAFVLQLELAGDGGQGGVDIEHARHRDRLARAQGAALGVRDDIFQHGDRQALRNARALVDFLVLARHKRELFDDLADVGRHDGLNGRGPVQPCFLLGDLEAVFERRRIVRADFAADAIFERRDDFAARRVILGISREHQQQIERQADRIAFNLHVAFLHDVEQANLNLAREVRQLVDGEDAAVGARD